VDPEFADPVTNRLNITGMAKCKAVQPGSDCRFGSDIPKPETLLAKGFGLLQFNHLSFLDYRSPHIKLRR